MSESKVWTGAVNTVTELINHRREEIPSEILSEAVNSVLTRLNAKVRMKLLNRSEMDYGQAVNEAAVALVNLPSWAELKDQPSDAPIPPVMVCNYCWRAIEGEAIISTVDGAEFCSLDHLADYESGLRMGHCALCSHLVLYHASNGAITDGAGRVFCCLDHKTRMGEGWDAACAFCGAEIKCTGEFTPSVVVGDSRVYCTPQHREAHYRGEAAWACDNCGQVIVGKVNERHEATMPTGERVCCQTCQDEIILARNPNAIGFCDECRTLLLKGGGCIMSKTYKYCGVKCRDAAKVAAAALYDKEAKPADTFVAPEMADLKELVPKMEADRAAAGALCKVCRGPLLENSVGQNGVIEYCCVACRTDDTESQSADAAEQQARDDDSAGAASQADAMALAAEGQYND